MPDSLKGRDNFGVDHYRPKDKFPELETSYLNLFYCCNQCNSRKRNYWPKPPKMEATHFIPNPCDHIMFAHLQFQGELVNSKSSAGEVAVRYLDLNDDQTLNFRKWMLDMIDLCQQKKLEILGAIDSLAKKRDAGEASAVEADLAIAGLVAKAADIDTNLARLTGD